jgi:hypothetical protein
MGIDYVQIPLSDETTYPTKPKVPGRPVYKPRRRCSPCKLVLLTLLIVFVVVPLVLGTIAAITGYMFMARTVKALTVTEPQSLPIVDYPEDEIELFKERVKLFFEDLNAGRIPEHDLVITADEVNGLFAGSDFLRGNAFVQMEENKLAIDTSLPIPSCLPGGRGRYFVSSSVANVMGDDLAVNVDAPIDRFHGILFTALLQFSLDDNTKHHIVSLLSGRAFDMELCDGSCQFSLDDDDDDDDFIRVLNRLRSKKGKSRSRPARPMKSPLRQVLMLPSCRLGICFAVSFR